jgi:molybdate transport system ATP-binding protein
MMLDVDIRLCQGEFVLEAAFAIPPGITALFGASGSGKSTLLAAIAGLRRNAGRIALNGRDISRAPPHRRGIGLVFQEPRLFPHLSVRGNLNYARRRARKPHPVETIALFFQIERLLDRRIANLSGGEKSRVALARALIAAPDLLLLDEPFAALDRPRRNAFISVLREIHHAFGTGMVVVSHDIEDICALADRVVALQEGRVVVSGGLSEVATDPAFRALLDPRDVGMALAANDLVSGYGTGKRLWLRADQVLLATRPPEAISARNVLEGRVAWLCADTPDSRLVAIETGGRTILSRLTPQACEALSLREGIRVWAIFKAHAL